MASATVSSRNIEHYCLNDDEQEMIKMFRGLSADSKRIILKRAEVFSKWDELTIEQQEELLKLKPAPLL